MIQDEVSVKVLSTTETYQGWRAACKRIALGAQMRIFFSGDKDIALCRFVPWGQVYITGEYYAEWDGARGTVEKFD